MTNEHGTELDNGRFDRLYTPWRMNYVRGDRRSAGCVFCDMRESNEDVVNLMLHRGEHSYVVMNLFPYNTGHLLIVPNEHAASPEELAPPVLHEIADFLPMSLRAIRLALAPAAFNVGYNLGDEAGAGIAAHMHQHIVPRWRGDANFMPIIGGTKVLPELVEVTYAKLRPEFLRDLASVVQINLTSADGLRTFVVRGNDNALTMPVIRPVHGTPAWRTATELIAGLGHHAQLVGWSEDAGFPTLHFRSDAPALDLDDGDWVDTDDVARLEDVD